MNEAKQDRLLKILDRAVSAAQAYVALQVVCAMADGKVKDRNNALELLKVLDFSDIGGQT